MSGNWWIGLVVVILIILGIYFFASYRQSPSPIITPRPTIVIQPTTASESTSPTISTTSPTSRNENKAKVTMKGFSFNPSSVTIKAGTTVEWINDDSAPHTVASDEGIFESKTLQPGENFSFTFKEAGNFPYYCSIHTYMQGKIIVTR